jgi:hypothetical protein
VDFWTRCNVARLALAPNRAVVLAATYVVGLDSHAGGGVRMKAASLLVTEMGQLESVFLHFLCMGCSGF